MNIVAFLLVLVGVIVFILNHMGTTRAPWATIPLGLALVWTGFIVQLIVKTEHLVTLTWH